MTEQITVVGNIVASPQRYQTRTGDTVVNFRVASSQRRYDETSRAWEDKHTNYFDVVAYRRLAEHALVSLQRGQRVIVTGSLKIDEWETGDKRGRSVDIVAAAIGPELRWGTATFTKTHYEPQDAAGDERPPGEDEAEDASAAVEHAPDHELVGAAVGGDAWAVPSDPRE